MKSQSPSNSIFDFDDPVDFLRQQHEGYKRWDAQFSLRSWSRRLGYANPSFVSQVFNRKRKINMDLAARIASDLKMKGAVRRYFELLCLRAANGAGQSDGVLNELIEKAKPKSVRQPISMRNTGSEMTEVIAHWIHSALLEMPQLEQFRADENLIRERLIAEVPATVIRAAMERLLRLGLLVQDGVGRLKRNIPENPIVFTDANYSEAVESRQRQNLENAKLALETQSEGERHMRGSTICFSRKNFDKVLAIINEAHRRILNLSESSGGDEICQFNTQFFQLTKGRRN